jgi:hypothetical protein
MINIVFADLSRCQDARLYVRQKLGATFEGLPPADLDRLTDAACAAAGSASLPLQPREALPRLSEAQQRSVDRKVRLFTTAVDRMSPLLDDETRRAEDYCSYLTQDAGRYSKGTPVLVRDTNQAKVCYVFENVSVDAVTGTVSYHTMPLLMASRDAVPGAEHHVREWMLANLAVRARVGVARAARQPPAVRPESQPAVQADLRQQDPRFGGQSFRASVDSFCAAPAGMAWPIARCRRRPDDVG